MSVVYQLNYIKNNIKIPLYIGSTKNPYNRARQHRNLLNRLRIYKSTKHFPKSLVKCLQFIVDNDGELEFEILSEHATRWQAYKEEKLKKHIHTGKHY